MPRCPTSRYGAASRARFLPERPLPPYAYVPGRGLPHPVRDPGGHSYGRKTPAMRTPAATVWQRVPAYLYGLDLFNCGYYWEAHESWESVWHAVRHDAVRRQLILGLIRLAAAGVKLREGNARGVRRHAEGAAGLFESVSRKLGNRTRCMGLVPGLLAEAARNLATAPAPARPNDPRGLGIRLDPR